MKTILILAPGSRGDVEPYVALGKGLIAAGFIVRLVTHQDFEQLVRSHGLEYWPLAGKVQEIVQNGALNDLVEKGNFLSIMAEMAREAERGALLLGRDSLAACQGVDLLLGGVGGLFTGLALAEKLRIPLLQAYYIPFTPTRAYPSFLLPPLPRWLGPLINRPSYQVARQVMWQSFRRADSLARRDVFDLPPAPLTGPYGSPWIKNTPVLYGYSPAVIPPAADWDARTHVTGYWFLDPPDDFSPPEGLVEFIENGPPPVYIGFGSMVSRDPQASARLALDALAQSGQRGVLQGGWGGLQAAELPATVYLTEAVPFAWLFPRMAAVVHHGGAGTTAAGLRAGVPSVITPFFADQPYWGRRVAELGAGPQPVPKKKLTAGLLAQAIGVAVNDEGIRRRAAELGEVIRKEDGVGEAVRIITEYFRY